MRLFICIHRSTPNLIARTSKLGMSRGRVAINPLASAIPSSCVPDFHNVELPRST